ncbi:3'(2'),5'-bisphosphate nucleotidase CysQ [Martelella lutilitoris]|uniref:3'(2'),5'-bisphosphate nucleotidase CysQ n=1 Tax=Martelella lutilitoris TaxID=2583532 RepID=A0A5C4JPV2_9HYPH|nr:3'(2'),5'-bisphosphate nucleotidase CysQ [Martelella lutilitoris]TNB47164.1 3'(2'),5'-bisphosphate nucleotidase CysQ [Martelella lutilitoris]
MAGMDQVFLDAALEAGRAIMNVYENGIDVSYKDDASPVTIADEKAEEIILGHLEGAFPDIPVVAEESVAAGRVPDIAGKSFFLVDPLDGTKEFINKREDFTVNIALIENGVPVSGIVYAPAKGVAYRTVADGAEKLVIADDAVTAAAPIRVREKGSELVAVASRSHNSPETEAFMKEIGVSDFTSVGSSLKFCIVAEGLADVYPRFGRTMEWDTAAGDAVLRAAGGITVGLDNASLPYGKTNQDSDSDFANPFFVGWGSSRAG